MDCQQDFVNKFAHLLHLMFFVHKIPGLTTDLQSVHAVGAKYGHWVASKRWGRRWDTPLVWWSKKWWDPGKRLNIIRKTFTQCHCRVRRGPAVCYTSCRLISVYIVIKRITDDTNILITSTAVSFPVNSGMQPVILRANVLHIGGGELVNFQERTCVSQSVPGIAVFTPVGPKWPKEMLCFRIENTSRVGCSAP